MKKYHLIRFLHLSCYLLVLVLLVIGFFIAGKGQEAFLAYLPEDGLVENLTVLFLFASCGISVYRCFNAPADSKGLYYVFWALLAFFIFFAAGEEISWGQRIFNFHTSGFFQEHNLQGETNLHNLVIGKVKINKLVFSQLMGIILGFYFILLRPLTMKSGFFHRLVKRSGIPLPRWEHVAAMVAGVVITSQYHLMKAAELREFAFAVIIFLVLLSPAELNPGKKTPLAA